MMTTLLLSQGVPMMLSGDECRRTQQGNNNAWCQDNEISWFDWSLVEEHAGLLRFVRNLVHFRRAQPTVRRPWFLTGEKMENRRIADVSWFDASAEIVDWHSDESPISCLLAAPDQEQDPERIGKDLFILMNPTHESVEFKVPKPVRRKTWPLLIDTAAESPHDFFGVGDGPKLSSRSIELSKRTTHAYICD